MTFEELIDRNPNIYAAKAIAILTNLTLTQAGAYSHENFNKAYQRISKNIESIMLTSSSVTKQYYMTNPKLIYFEDKEIGSDAFEYLQDNERYIIVNFVELLAAYNKCRAEDGLSEIQLYAPKSDNVVINNGISAYELADFATITCKIVHNIASRDDKLKRETVETIIDEGLKAVTNETIKVAIPKIRSELISTLRYRITEGRLNKVQDKKLQSAIYLTKRCLTDKVTAALVESNRLKYRKDLAKFDLSTADRDHVLDTFIEYERVTEQE